jgi:phosphoribosylanthranilate isomerase
MTQKMERRTRVKICGVTNRADAEAAIALGADALGFNAWLGSKRFIDLQKEAEWIRALPPFVTKVAVMVNPTLAEAEQVLALPFIDTVQLHGHEDAEFCASIARLGRQFLKAIAVRDAASLENVARFCTSQILLDAFSPTAFGGTGKKIDLDLAEQFTASHSHLRVILSGGLTPENVAEAVRRMRPYAVDVASGVEVNGDPRRKDHAKLRAFIEAV